MRLFIAEKPSLGRAIADNIGVTKKCGGYIECGSDVVTWCFGHLLELATPEDYDPALKRWTKESLPIVPDEFRLLPRKDAKEQLGVIKKLLSQCSEVVNAGDPDREGQLLVDEVLEHFGNKKPVKRIWLASLDPKSVQKALAELKENSGYFGFREAASARREMDWLGGMNLTRAMTVMGRGLGLDGVLSLGRVQTPTLALVVGRDLEIEHFRPVDYAALKILAKHANGEFWASFNIPAEGEGVSPAGYLVDFKVAEQIRKDSEGRKGRITKAETKSGKENPPLCYSLSTLQKDAASLYGLGAQETLDIAQKLYESQLTTYPRSDCQYLPDEQFGNAESVLDGLRMCSQITDIAHKANFRLKSAVWNTGKVTAHHAIIPTGMDASHLSGKEKDLYILICVRYIEQFYPALEYKSAVIDILLDNQTSWTARGRVVTKKGWKECLNVLKEKDEKAEAELPQAQKGDSVTALKCEMEKKQTKPPSRFSEGTLIEAMSGIHVFVDNKEAKARLKETSGLGTEATRAGIIETLKKRGYLEPKGKSLVSTPLGREIISLCPEPIKDIVTTALMEDDLADIQAGKKKSGVIVNDYAATLKPMVDAIFGAQKLSGKHLKIEAHPCPKCGRQMARRKGKAGFFWGCTGYPDCRVIMSDERGKPGKVVERSAGTITPPVEGVFKCPLCDSQLKYGISKSGNPYWACFNKSPKHGRAAKFWNARSDGKPDF